MDHYILRSWQCLNKRCNAAFESGERYPQCPRCGNVRVDWIPGGGHVGGMARSCDAEFRALADVFKLSEAGNFRHGEKGQRAKPPLPSPAAAGPQISFGPGFSAPLTPYAVAVPSTSKLDVKAKVAIGRSFGQTGQRMLGADLAGNTRIEGKHKP